MGLQPLKLPPYKTPKTSIARFSSWRRGLNTLFRETEIDPQELVSATDLLLVGSGIPTKRWGSSHYFLAGATGYGRGLAAVKDANDNIQVLAITDQGILTKQSGASYTILTGASFASGYNVEMAELNANVYLMNGQQPFTKYNFTSLTGFATLTDPTALTVTNFSGATGGTTWSWIVTAVSQVGETVGSTPVSLASLPVINSSSPMYIILNWTATSAASGVLKGYNIYRGTPGNEVGIGGVAFPSTQFIDFGTVPQYYAQRPPLTNTTGGLLAKYIIRWKDRLIMSGVPGDPTAVYISGTVPNHEKLDAQFGGAYIRIEPSSGEDITGIASYYQATAGMQTLIVFKEKSVWEVRLDIVQGPLFPVTVPSYRLLTASQGCSSHRSITQVENDLMFVNRRGMFILRYEPQLLNVINANEISAKIRPYFLGLSYSDISQASGMYADKKYIVSFPSVKQSIMFDRERLCFMGPWNHNNAINKWAVFFDSAGIERRVAIDADDRYVNEFRDTFPDENGTAFRTLLKTKKEDFGDWSLFKSLSEVYFLLANLTGSVQVNIYLEQRNGATIVAKSLTITSTFGQSGFGTDLFGLNPFGLSQNNAKFSSNETPRRTFLYKTTRTFQMEVITNNSGDNYQLLQILAVAISQARGNAPSSWLV